QLLPGTPAHRCVLSMSVHQVRAGKPPSAIDARPRGGGVTTEVGLIRDVLVGLANRGQGTCLENTRTKVTPDGAPQPARALAAGTSIRRPPLEGRLTLLTMGRFPVGRCRREKRTACNWPGRWQNHPTGIVSSRVLRELA